MNNEAQTPAFPSVGDRARRNWLPALLLMALTIMAYQPAWHAGIIWDDDDYITPLKLRSLNGLARIWTQPGATHQYYPLVHTVFWVEHKLCGDATTEYHWVNILLHASSALLVAKILRRLKIPGAWLAAALFALHPVEVESVAWITELKNTLSGLFYLSATLVYLGFDRKRSWENYALALGLFILGLLCKTVIATLPAALLVVLWWQRGKLSWKRDVLALTPFFIAGLGAGLFTAWMERKFVGAAGAEFDFSLLQRILIAGRDIWFYLAKLCWPVNLAFIYHRWNVSQGVWWQYLFPAAALLLLALLYWRRWRGPLAGLLFFVGTFFQRVSVPLFVRGGSFPISGKPGSIDAGRGGGQRPARFVSETKTLSRAGVVRHVAIGSGILDVETMPDVRQRRNTLAHYAPAQSRLLDGRFQSRRRSCGKRQVGRRHRPYSAGAATQPSRLQGPLRPCLRSFA
jgi:hypothetical protein